MAITLRDANKSFGPIDTFTHLPELNGILNRVVINEFVSIQSMIFTQTKFNLDKLYTDYPEYRKVIGSDGKDKRFDKPILGRLNIFSKVPVSSTDIKTLGRLNNQRTYRYIAQEYVDMTHENIHKWKVIIPVSNGSGAIGEALSTPLIGKPLIGYTRSFMSFGAFDEQSEAEAMLKYVKSKFARTMLGVLKITQDNTSDKWAKVPIQNFTQNSDIDWSKSIPEIDQQLYKKYGLSQEEIDFIESRVKSME